LPTFIHPTSEVHASASIGPDTKVWHFCHVMAGARIGERCILGQNVFVARNVRVGNDVKIQNNVSLYEGVELEDGVFCGPSCVFTNVNTPRSRVSRKNEYVKTKVGEGATIGANATIVCGNNIGRYAFVGAASLVTENVPDHALVYGVPAKQKGWMCECGEKLNFKGTAASCKRCKDKYLKTGRTLRKSK
jgi:UDP-2-acetamido-3-amino-2,3-dideoxy-glucuronate N-acetyltransferase